MSEDKEPIVIMKVWSSSDEEVYLEVDIKETLERLTPDSWAVLFEFGWEGWQLNAIVEFYRDTACKELFDWFRDNDIPQPKEYDVQIDWRDALKWLLWHRDRSLTLINGETP